MQNISVNDLGWVGVCTAGIVKNGEVVYVNNLDWHNEKFAKILNELLGFPTYIANDGNAAAYAEADLGSGAGDNLLVPLCERVLHETFGINGGFTKLVTAKFRNGAGGIMGAALLGLQN